MRAAKAARAEAERVVQIGHERINALARRAEELEGQEDETSDRDDDGLLQVSALLSELEHEIGMDRR